MIKAFFARNIFDPLHVYIYRKDSRLSLYRYFRKRERAPLEENIKIQRRQLYELLRHTLDYIPYYQKKKIHLSEETVFEDIKKFPILTKDIIRNHLDDLKYVRKGTNWFYNSSGGSTGEPVKFIQDDMMVAGQEATTREQYDWLGYEYGRPLIRLWGSEKDFFKLKHNLYNRFAGWVRSETLLNTFMMDDAKKREFVASINKIKPQLIVAYAESMYELARFIDEHQLKVYSPPAIMTSASILYPEHRKLIEKVFRCHVYNRYGSREVGNIAAECEKHEGLHISIFTHYIEILDKKLKPCKPGEQGDIYITLLTNYTMPLIRYKIGDMAIHTDRKCSCGRGLPMLQEVIGRDNDLLLTMKGAHVHGGIINYLFFFKDYIKNYQVRQKRPDHLVVSIVPAHKFSAREMKEIEKIRESLKEVFGEECRIEIKYVKEIKPTVSGKHRFTIREF